jgi:hypothetical protein
MMLKKVSTYLKRILGMNSDTRPQEVSSKRLASFFLLLTSKVQAVIQMEEMGLPSTVESVEENLRKGFPDCVAMIETKTGKPCKEFLVEFKAYLKSKMKAAKDNGEEIDITPVLERILAEKEPF